MIDSVSLSLACLLTVLCVNEPCAELSLVSAEALSTALGRSLSVNEEGEFKQLHTAIQLLLYIFLYERILVIYDKHDSNSTNNE